jgi:hypothetical protein
VRQMGHRPVINIVGFVMEGDVYGHGSNGKCLEISHSCLISLDCNFSFAICSVSGTRVAKKRS